MLVSYAGYCAQGREYSREQDSLEGHWLNLFALWSLYQSCKAGIKSPHLMHEKERETWGIVLLKVVERHS